MTPSLVIPEGAIYRNEDTGREFEILQSPEPGAGEAAPVEVEFEDGEIHTFYYDHFTGRNSPYTRVEQP